MNAAQVTEEWHPIPSAPHYEADTLGRIRSLARPDAPRILTQSPSGRYLKVGLSANGWARAYKVHVLVAEAFYGSRPAGLVIRHLNGDSNDNRAANLAYGTQAENNRDIVRHGRHNYAGRSHCSRGHEYTPENTILRTCDGRTSRVCRTCKNERRRKPVSPP